MIDEKDRLGDKLKEKEQAEEDRFFRQRDQEAIERLRQQKETAVTTGTCQCPKDGTALVKVEHHGVNVEECPKCHGVWLDPGECELLAQRERDSWLGRLFYRPRV